MKKHLYRREIDSQTGKEKIVFTTVDTSGKVTIDHYTVDSSQCERTEMSYVSVTIRSELSKTFYFCYCPNGTVDLYSDHGFVCKMDSNHTFRATRIGSAGEVCVVISNRTATHHSVRQYDLFGKILFAEEIVKKQKSETKLAVDFTKKTIHHSFDRYVCEEESEEEVHESGSSENEFIQLEYKKIELDTVRHIGYVELILATTADGDIKIYSLSYANCVCESKKLIQIQRVLGRIYLKVLSSEGSKEIYELSGYRISYTRPELAETDTNVVFTGCDTAFEIKHSNGRVETYNMEGQMIHVTT